MPKVPGRTRNWASSQAKRLSAVAIAVVLLGFGAAASDASSKSTLYSQIAALGRSPTGKRARAILDGALSSGAVRRLSTEVLREDVSALTPLQRATLEAETLLAAPASEQVLSALQHRRTFSHAQVRALVKLIDALGNNQAINAMIQQGRALQSNRAALASVIAPLLSPALGRVSSTLSTGDSKLDSVVRGLDGADHSPVVEAYESRMGSLLKNGRAVALVSKLPPLILGSLTSAKDLLSASHASAAVVRRTARASSVTPGEEFEEVANEAIKDRLIDFFVSYESLPVNTQFEIRNTLARTFGGGDIAVELEEFAGALGGPDAGAAAVIVPYVGGFFAGTELANYFFGGRLAALELKPAEAKVKVGQSQRFTVIAITAAGVRRSDSVPLTIVPDPPGTCVAQTCESSQPGTYLVKAQDGDAEGTALLRVEASQGSTAGAGSGPSSGGSGGSGAGGSGGGGGGRKEGGGTKTAGAQDSLSAGEGVSCAVLSSGGIDCWGGETVEGQTAFAVPAVSNAIAVSGGNGFECALLSAGPIDCWGANSVGELGSETEPPTFGAPVEVTGISDAASVSAGLHFACALLSTGHLACWGTNGIGELGDGTIVGPEECIGLHASEESCSRTPVAVSGISNAIAVSAGVTTACAVLSTGGVDCWGAVPENPGEGFSGTPVEVPGISNAVAVAAGPTTCALLSTGHVDCWGRGQEGELGNGINEGSTTPVEVSGISNAVAVSAGFYYTCALLSTGDIDCWGQNEDGELGNGTQKPSSTPVEVSGISNAVAVSAGIYHTCALLSTGGVDCWGLLEANLSSDVPRPVTGFP
jgi:Regulator of chromosome condensation (RCC1) repeat